ncbi:MAG: AbgT family transporter [Ilumatobacteraceae bacterium]
MNLLITPTDAVLTEITNEAIGLVEPGRTIDITANLYFSIGSTIVLTILLAVVSQRVVEPRLGAYDPPPPHRATSCATSRTRSRASRPGTARGLRWAGFGFVAALAVVLLLTLPSGAPLRDPETGDIIGTSPFMDSLIVIIALLFLAAGLGYGREPARSPRRPARSTRSRNRGQAWPGCCSCSC